MKKILFVSDLFVEDYMGGAELTTEALIESSNETTTTVRKIRCKDVKKEHIQEMRDVHWVICNFSTLSNDIKLEIAKNANYSIIEYDYKFCIYRSVEKHLHLEGKECDCTSRESEKINLVFYGYAEKIWFMSQQQREIFIENVRTIKEENTSVLSSAFSEESIQFFEKINTQLTNRTTNKSNNYIIFNSNSWIKGVDDSISKAVELGLNYEKVANLSYSDMLKKLLSSRGLVFLPKGGDTCPRLVIEAKLMGCELVINDNVQHATEDWFDDRESILSYLKENKKKFWNYYE